MYPRSDKDRLNKHLESLAKYNSEPGNPGITRVHFSDEDLGAREYIKSLMSEAGLDVCEDPIGNIYGTLPGTDFSLEPVWTGSHIDTVLNAGKYDGTVGVIGAIEACRNIIDSGAPRKRDITIVVFSSEEPTRFGAGCVGSRAMAGRLSLDDTKKLADKGGRSLYDVLQSLDYPLGDYDAVIKKPGDIFAFVELHIEQASTLEELGLPIAVVSGICAPTDIHLTLTGQQKHAGSTKMDIRRDPVCAAAEIILELERLARSFKNDHTVATVGKINAFPNASNVIAGSVSFTIDIRDINMDDKSRIRDEILTFSQNICKERGIGIKYTIISDDVPVHSDERVMAVIEDSCKKLRLPYTKKTSGAYHDALHVSSFAPMAMIFVPSRDGISHDPAEYTSPEELAVGTDVLAQTLLALSCMDSL
ncbi:MAG: M20 family metallo-hydrolase [Oscillospiraceae bacterium]